MCPTRHECNRGSDERYYWDHFLNETNSFTEKVADSIVAGRILFGGLAISLTGIGHREPSLSDRPHDRGAFIGG